MDFNMKFEIKREPQMESLKMKLRIGVMKSNC